jgi:predicted nucleotidyltransferase
MKRLNPIEKIYCAFYDGKQTELYYNQLKEITKLSDSSLQNALKKLEVNNEVIVKKQKANTYYSLKNKKLTALHFTAFDYEKLEMLTRDTLIPIKKFISELPKSNGFIILFGSASRKQERKDSDIDILVVLHEFNNPKLQKEYEQEMKREIEELKDRISATSIHPITVFYTTINEFKSSEDRLVTEARDTGFCIEGNLTYYEVMLDE